MNNPRSRPYARLLFAGLGWLVTIAGQSVAQSQSVETATEPEAPIVRDARAAFVRGTALAKETRWGDALDAFRRSYELKPHPITSYNLGYCERAIGRYTRAYQLLRRALREDAAAVDGRLPERLAESSKQYLAEIETRLARVTVSINPVEARMLVDGRPLDVESDTTNGSPTHSLPVLLAGTRDAGAPEPVPASRFDLLLDPGTHILALSGPGVLDAVRTQHFEPGSKGTLELILPTAQTPAPTPPAHVTRFDGASARPWAYAAVGVGAASLTMGTIAGIAALRKRSTLVDQCGPTRNACPAASENDLRALGTYADLSTIALAVGGVGVVAGVGALFLMREKSVGHETRLSITPIIGLGSAGLSGRF